MANNDAARRALLRLGELSAAERRLTGTIIAVRGRNVTVLLDGEGAGTRTAHRGVYEPAIGAGVTIERVPDTDFYKVVGVRDTSLGAVDSRPYDFERQGSNLFYPVPLEAINDAAYHLGEGLEITVRNVQFVSSGQLVYIPSQTLDLSSYVPATDSKWVIICANPSGNTLTVYGDAAPTDTPDTNWPSVVSAALTYDTGMIPLLAVRLDADQTEWTNAHRALKRGYSFQGKRIIRISYSGGGAGGGGLSEVAPINLTGFTSESGVTGNVIVQDDTTFIFAKHDTGDTAPDATFDSTQGYNVGSLYKTDTAVWICVDASEGVAEWVQIYPDTTNLSSPPAIGDVTPAPSVETDELRAFVAYVTSNLWVTGTASAELLNAYTVVDTPLLTADNVEISNTLTLPPSPPANGQLGFTNNRAAVHGRGVAQALSGRWYSQGGVRAIINTTTNTTIEDAIIPDFPANSLNVGTTIHGRAFGVIDNAQGAARNGTLRHVFSGNIHAVPFTAPAGVTTWHAEFYADVQSLGVSGYIGLYTVLYIGSTRYGGYGSRFAIDTTTAKAVSFAVEWSSYTPGTTLAFYAHGMVINIEN